LTVDPAAQQSARAVAEGQIRSGSRSIAALSAVVVITALVFVACGGGGDSSGSPATKAKPEDVDMTAADFPNVLTMAKVGNYYVANRLGHLSEAVAVARSPKGGRFPVGTLVQLVPQEAMVKRRPGWNPATRDWEFFFLDVSPTGTKIVHRGTKNVVNRFGGNCASCHLGADKRWDMICRHDHGCAPLPIDDSVIAAIQQADPRPR
jgi:hypothetical protein